MENGKRRVLEREIEREGEGFGKEIRKKRKWKRLGKDENLLRRKKMKK